MSKIEKVIIISLQFVSLMCLVGSFVGIFHHIIRSDVPTAVVYFFFTLASGFMFAVISDEIL
tara:strand:- start:277 stop:462 length:186 start_codon:yes stop_codon:yes gene_type:complete